jgi:dTDP-4-dehydrorhamnose 3,5-epimerase
MIFTETCLKGAFVIDLERLEDQRGFFARSWCEREFAGHHLETKWVQANISYNKKKGTLRGMHFQVSPHEEEKLVRCIRGKLFDVIVDFRQGSDTFKKWFGVELSAENRRMIYIPKEFAHGFVTMDDDNEVFYLMSEFYAPGYGRGIRWDDPAIGIIWPEKITVISDQDKNYSTI